MVAYSFQKRFVAAIRSGAKRQTIRAQRNRPARHARPGEPLQLFHGMRTRHCTRIIPDPTCVAILALRLVISEGCLVDLVVSTRCLGPAEFDAFARRDGFSDASDMAAFWISQHCPGQSGLIFNGWLIEWLPQGEPMP